MKIIRKITYCCLFLLIVLSACGKPETGNSLLKDGDIIFQTSKSAQSKAIQLATKSKYSHMGIIFFRNGKPFVLEAVEPVKYTPLKAFIDKGNGGHYIVKRLKNEANLKAEDIESMRETGESFLGKHYDLYFEWSDERIYCSELVWKIYNRALGINIGNLSELGSFNLSSKEVKAKLKERYGENIPVGEKVISPAEMFNSVLLKKVIEK